MQKETLVSHSPGRLPSQSKAVCHDLHLMYPPTPYVGCIFSWGKPSSCVWVLLQLVFTMSLWVWCEEMLACPAWQPSANKRDSPCYWENIISLQICPKLYRYLCCSEKGVIFSLEIDICLRACVSVFFPTHNTWLAFLKLSQLSNRKVALVFVFFIFFFIPVCGELTASLLPSQEGKNSRMNPQALSHHLSQQKMATFVVLEGKWRGDPHCPHHPEGMVNAPRSTRQLPPKGWWVWPRATGATLWWSPKLHCSGFVGVKAEGLASKIPC